MDNDDKTIGHILSRREILNLAGASGLTFLLRGSAQAQGAAKSGAVDLVATPEMTEGPFFVDEKLNRADVVNGTDRSSVRNGLPLDLRFTVLALKDGKGSPLRGAHVDIWHCDAIGVYSDEGSSGIQQEDTRGQNWLRGYQVTDGEGVAQFKTIYPGWYLGRTVHIHFKIRTYDKSGDRTHEFTSQLFFSEPDNEAVLAKAPYSARGQRRVKNMNDGIYAYRQADGTAVGSHLEPKLTDTKGGKFASFSVALDLG